MTTEDKSNHKFIAKELSNEDVKFLYKNYYTNEKPQGFGTKVLNALKFVSNKLFDAVVFMFESVGYSIEQLFALTSRLIQIRIGLFDASKVSLCEEIKRLEGELAESKLKNKRLDSENYLLYNSLTELEVAGNRTYDKCVQWFGLEAEEAIRWRTALLSSNASRGFNYDEASYYHDARVNHEWMEQSCKKQEKKEDEKPKGRSSSRGKKRKN